MQDRETNLTPEEQKEYRDLRRRLHELHPDHGHDQDAENPIPHNVGRGELESLRQEVKVAEVKHGRAEHDRDDDHEPEIGI